jgi:hypothetical protein
LVADAQIAYTRYWNVALPSWLRRSVTLQVLMLVG